MCSSQLSNRVSDFSFLHFPIFLLQAVKGGRLGAGGYEANFQGLQCRWDSVTTYMMRTNEKRILLSVLNLKREKI